MYVFDEFELDTRVDDLRHRGKLVKAEATVMRLLSALVRRGEGELVTKDELIEDVWEGRALADNAITVCVARLRKLLREHGGERDYIMTVYGKGYRFMRPVRRADTVSSSIPRSGPGSEPPEEAPCVGRERVLVRLLRLHELAQGERGSACVVMGEAGIGKTRVIETFARRLGGRARVVWAYCRDTGTAPPLSPWLRLVRTAASDAWTPELERALGPHAPRVRSWLGKAPAAGEAPGQAPARPGAAASGDRHATYDAILQTLALLARAEPLCLVLDDLQWADAASLELLALALDEIAQTRIQLLCTMRKLHGTQVQREQTHLPAVLGHRNCERISLPRLTKTDVEEYLRARLPGDERPLADAVFAYSEGVPFFMVELVRQLETLEGPVPREFSVPGAALELFRGRVAKLSDDAQEVLRAGAVIGRAFELPLLEAVVELPAARTLAGVDEAIAHDIVVAAPGSSSAFEFGHELMRRAIYDSLAGATRRRLHLRVAEAVEQRGDADEHATHELAYHLHAALPEADPEKAARYCEQAAHIAGAAYANTDAVTHLCHALEALALQREPNPADRARLLMMKVMYSRGQKGFHASLEAVHRLAAQLGDGRLLTLVACMFQPHPILQPVPGVAPVLEQALSLLKPEDQGVRGAALAASACHPPDCYDRDVVEARLAEAEALARGAEDRRPLYPVLLAKLHLTGGREEPGHRQGLREELEELAHRHAYVMRVLPIDVALDLALENAQQGRLGEAEAALRRARRLARAINHRELQWHVERMRAWARIDGGDPEQGASELTRLHRRAARQEVVGLELFCAFDRCMLLPDAGAAQFLDDADLWALSYEPSDPVHVWAMKIRALAAAGFFQEARTALHELAASDLPALPDDGQRVGSLAQLARASVALDEREHAAALAELLADIRAPYAVNIAYRSEGAVAAVVGELLAFLQQPKAACTHLQRGLALEEQAGLRRCSEHTRAVLARQPRS